MDRVFISYSNTDAAVVDRLAMELTGLGIAVAIAPRFVDAVQPWDQSIQEALEACSYVIVVVSPESMASRNVMDEVAFAADRSLPLVAVVVKSADLPLALARCARVDCRQTERVECAEGVAAALAQEGLSFPVPLDHDLWRDFEPFDAPSELRSHATYIPEHAARVVYYSLEAPLRARLEPGDVLDVLELLGEYVQDALQESDEPDFPAATAQIAAQQGLPEDVVSAIVDAEEIYLNSLGLLRDEAPPPLGSDIGVVHSMEDASFARQMIEALVASGFDATSLSIRDDREDNARQASEAVEGCNCIIVLLSPAAVASDRVADLWSEALRHGQLTVPAIIETCQVPFRLERLNSLDLRGDWDLSGFNLIGYLENAGITPAEEIVHFSRLCDDADNAYDDGDLERALDVWDRAIAIEPDSAIAHNNRAVVLWDLGRHEDALRDCDVAIELDPDGCDTHLMKSEILVELARPEEALLATEIAGRLSPGDPKVALKRAEALLAADLPEEAVEVLEQALATSWTEPDLHDALSRALDRLGAVDEALDAIAVAIELAPENVAHRRNRYYFLLQAGRYADVPDVAETAIELDPGNASDHAACALAYDALGRQSQALRACERALELDPTNEGIAEMRSRLLDQARP